MNLRTFSTIKIGGEVERSLRASEVRIQDLAGLPQPLRILGNGSNVLIDDRGLRGTVLIGRDKDFKEPQILKETKNDRIVRFSGGTFLPRLAKWCSSNGLSGAEYMVGVPGTLGGAVAQNAGANQQELSDILIQVEGINLESKDVFRMDSKDCQLQYRHSRFKDEALLLIQQVTLRLSSADSVDIEERLEKNLAYRKDKTPYSKPSLGSIFTRLWDRDKSQWLYPGQLIEQSGLKGLKRGGARVSEKHANYIVNEGGATFDDVYQLLLEVEKRVKEETGIDLEREIEIWSDRL